MVTPTLKNSSDFQRVSRSGKRAVFPSFIMLALRREEDAPFRLGLTASRKVGNAVVRNRAKRRLREMVRLHESPQRLAGWDIVLIAKTERKERGFAEMQQDFRAGLKRLGAET